MSLHGEEVQLATDQLQSLGAALGVDETRTADRIVDIDGRAVVRDGYPVPEVEGILRTFLDQRGNAVIRRCGADGSSTDAMIWLSRHGILHAQQTRPDVFTLRADSGGALYRVLIDALGLGHRPMIDDDEPVLVPRSSMEAQVWLNESAGPKARRTVAEKFRDRWPAVAESLTRDDGDLVSIRLDWDGPDQRRRESLHWIDTPEGLLMHGLENQVLSQRHVLTAVNPAWLWVHVLDRLPTAADIDGWFQQAEAS